MLGVGHIASVPPFGRVTSDVVREVLALPKALCWAGFYFKKVFPTKIIYTNEGGREGEHFTLSCTCTLHNDALAHYSILVVMLKTIVIRRPN